MMAIFPRMVSGKWIVSHMKKRRRGKSPESPCPISLISLNSDHCHAILFLFCKAVFDNREKSFHAGETHLFFYTGKEVGHAH
jgi:hypothetical protein